MTELRETPDLSTYSAAHFDRGTDPLREFFWHLVSLFFFRLPFPLPSGIRVFWLQLFGAKIGSRVVIRSGVQITFPWRLTLESNVWIGEGVYIHNLAPVRIERSVCVSQRAFICTGSHNYKKKSFDLITEPITIRKGAWIAAQAFIGPGVEIGEGSVITAGSVISKNVPSNNVARGNPPVLQPIA